MSYSLDRCLGCLLEPPIAGVTATGVNWCIWSPDDCIVIGARGVILRKAPAAPVTPRNVRAVISRHVYFSYAPRVTAAPPTSFAYT